MLAITPILRRQRFRHCYQIFDATLPIAIIFFSYYYFAIYAIFAPPRFSMPPDADTELMIFRHIAAFADGHCRRFSPACHTFGFSPLP